MGHRLTSGLVHAALYRDEHVATALTVLKHHAVRGQRSSAFWTPPKRWPLIVLAITGFVIALGLPLADSRWPPVVIGIASGVAPVVMYLVWNGQFRSTRPMLLDHAKRIEEVEKDRQGEMATTPVPVSPTVVIEKVYVPLALGLAMIGTLVGWAGARTAGDHRHWTTRSVNPAPPP